MSDFIKAKRTTKRLMHAGQDSVQFAKKFKYLDNKQRWKLIFRLWILIIKSVCKWYIRETWSRAKNVDATHHGNIPLMNVPRYHRNETGQIETHVEIFKSQTK